MPLILPVLSFLCAGLLAVFLIVLIRRPTVNTSNVAMIIWLLLGNTVHAVNALVWFSNTETRIPVWCDIGKCEIDFRCFWTDCIQRQ